MKKILLLAVMAIFAIPVLADLNGDGYYRAQNAFSKRYAYLLDDKGSVNYHTTSADVQAIALFTEYVRACSDPASIFYVSNASGSLYNIGGQGTDLYKFFESYVKILSGKSIDDVPAYLIYASKSGMTKYLGDLSSISEGVEGYASVEAQGDNRYWYLHQVKADSDYFFGITPTVEANGSYYHPLFTSFPFAAYSPGVKFYVVTEIDTTYKFVRITEVTGNVPAGVPVIVECANPLPSDNRLTVGPAGDSASIPANYLRGVYFANESKSHRNLTDFNKSTMRVLANVDGQLMFVRGDYDFVPRNQAYLLLPEGEACDIDSYRVLKEGESGVEAVIEADALVEVYRIDGTRVSGGMPKSELNSLPHGVYLLRCGDRCEKHFVN